MSYRLEALAAGHEEAFLAMIRDYDTHDAVTRARLYPGEWTSSSFGKLVRLSEKERRDWRPSPTQVSITRYLLLDPQGQICGSGAMRFPLQEDGRGNLEFDVPPSMRRQGFGALTLNRMLFEAVRAGLARVLVVAEESNLAACRAIEKNRAELESTEGGLRRYWIRLR